MKKNFLMVASLLIAAMLMVVSCTQEVAPKNELVMASIGIAYGKDVTVGYGNTPAAITYQYKLTALWDKLENGSDPYGGSSTFLNMFGVQTKKIGDTNIVSNLNYVTPGYWLVEVQGFVEVQGPDGSKVKKAVLKGSTKAYFNKRTTNATVYVAPVAEPTAKGTITLNLQMEDLDISDATGNTSKIYYYLDTPASIDSAKKYLTKGAVVAEGKAAHNYTARDNTITSGYHTITIKVEGYEGGITKSFLMIPGNDVTINGSVYPSQFKDINATIQVVSLGSANITVGEGVNAREFANPGMEPVVVTGGSPVKVSIGNFTNPGNGGTFSYEWYLDGVKQGIDIDEDRNNTITVPNTPGDYNITCVAKYTYSDVQVGQVTVYGNSLYAGKVRVTPVAATTNP